MEQLEILFFQIYVIGYIASFITLMLYFKITRIESTGTVKIVRDEEAPDFIPSGFLSLIWPLVSLYLCLVFLSKLFDLAAATVVNLKKR